MEDSTNLTSLKNVARIQVKLAEVFLQKQIAKNKLRALTGINHEAIDRYYKNKNIVRVALDALAKLCFVLDCTVNDLLEYEPEQKKV